MAGRAGAATEPPLRRHRGLSCGKISSREFNRLFDVSRLTCGRAYSGQPTLDDLLLASPRPLLFAAVDGLTSAENLGSVVRNCAGFGIQALVVSESSTSPYLRRAVRSSMGTIFQLPVIEASDFTEVVAKLKNNGVRCVAAHPHEDRTLTRTSLIGDCCIILGSEVRHFAAPDPATLR